MTDLNDGEIHIPAHGIRLSENVTPALAPGSKEYADAIARGLEAVASSITVPQSALRDDESMALFVEGVIAMRNAVRDALILGTSFGTEP